MTVSPSNRVKRRLVRAGQHGRKTIISYGSLSRAAYVMLSTKNRKNKVAGTMQITSQQLLASLAAAYVYMHILTRLCIVR